MRALFILIVASLGDLGCRDAALPWPTTSWAESTPETEGVNSAVLAQLDSEFVSGRYGYVNGFLVIRHGAIVYERSYTHDYNSLFVTAPDQRQGPYNYYDPSWHPYYQEGPLQIMQSVSTSVTSALIGIALQRGEIPSIDVNGLQFFSRYRVPDNAQRRKLTLRHLLTMSAGIQWEEVALSYTGPNNTCAQMEAARDWVQFVLDQPQVAEPGATFVYDSGATQLLSQVLKHATGMHADAYAQAHLFKPLGVSSYYWKHIPTGHADTEGGLYLLPRDLAKIGYLFLRGGVWDGTRSCRKNLFAHLPRRRSVRALMLEIWITGSSGGLSEDHKAQRLLVWGTEGSV